MISLITSSTTDPWILTKGIYGGHIFLWIYTFTEIARK